MSCHAAKKSAPVCFCQPPPSGFFLHPNLEDNINVSNGDPKGKESKVSYKNIFSSSRQYIILFKLSIFSLKMIFSDYSSLLQDTITI